MFERCHGQGQDAVPRIVVGNDRDLADRQALPESFEAAEDERLVPAKRASRGAAKLVAPEGRRTYRMVEEVAGIESAVSDKLEERAVKLIGSGHGHQTDLSARPLAVFGAIGVLQDVELAHRVHAQ